MGNQQNDNSCLGQCKVNQPERFIDNQRRRNKERQQQHCLKKRESFFPGVLENCSVQDNVPLCEIIRGAQLILESIDETLQNFAAPEARDHVMQRVLAGSVSSGNLSSSFPSSYKSKVERDIVSGLQQSLVEVKSAKISI